MTNNSADICVSASENCYSALKEEKLVNTFVIFIAKVVLIL